MLKKKGKSNFLVPVAASTIVSIGLLISGGKICMDIDQTRDEILDNFENSSQWKSYQHLIAENASDKFASSDMSYADYLNLKTQLDKIYEDKDRKYLKEVFLKDGYNKDIEEYVATDKEYIAGKAIIGAGVVGLISTAGVSSFLSEDRKRKISENKPKEDNSEEMGE